MVFSSIPVYLDPPNWQQQPNHHNPLGSVAAIGSENPHELPPLAPLPTLTHVGGGGSGAGVGFGQAGSVRPSSMSDRARLAKIPQPETALKCPRCESTNTKFCYFNNYSLSQPRHFCKTCRRYWTRGGALRNVPVGGGCRRNKKSKSNNNSSSSSRSKSPVANNSTADHIQTGSNSITNHASSDHHHMISPTHHLSQQLPLLAQSIQSLGRYSGAANMGLNFINEIHQGQPSDHHHNMGFQFHQIGGNNNLSGGILGADHNQWRNLNLQQIPFMGGTGFDSSSATGLYSFHQSGQGMDHHQEPSDPMASNNSRVNTDDQLPPPVKMEDNHGLRLTRPNSLGTSTSANNISENNNSQFWGGNLNAWTDLSGLNSSSTSHLL